MAVFTPEATPTDTILAKSFEYAVDISEDGQTWQRIRFASAVDPKTTNVTADAATYEDKGAPHPIVTGEEWSLSQFIQLHRTTAGKYLPEVEMLLKKTKPGADNTIHVRYYDNPSDEGVKPNEADAFKGQATVSIERAQTANAEIAGFNVTFTGQGARTAITNPLANSDAS